MMIVIIGGMHRSGSTFTFNIAREILANQGGVSIATADSLERGLASDDSVRNLIIKTHNPEPLITSLIKKEAFYCICTIRKPEDAVASWMRTFEHDFETSIAIIKSWLEWYRLVFNHVLQIDYETIDLYPLFAILRIQKYLVGRINLIDAIKLRRKYDKKRLKRHYDALKEAEGTINMGFSYYDSETFLHRRHISSIKSRPAQADLTYEQILFIREHLNGFVDQEGAIEKNATN